MSAGSQSIYREVNDTRRHASTANVAALETSYVPHLSVSLAKLYLPLNEPKMYTYAGMLCTCMYIIYTTKVTPLFNSLYRDVRTSINYLGWGAWQETVEAKVEASHIVVALCRPHFSRNT